MFPYFIFSVCFNVFCFTVLIISGPASADKGEALALHPTAPAIVLSADRSKAVYLLHFILFVRRLVLMCLFHCSSSSFGSSGSLNCVIVGFTVYLVMRFKHVYICYMHKILSSVLEWTLCILSSRGLCVNLRVSTGYKLLKYLFSLLPS